MATFKACVQKQRKDGLYQVYIRATHAKKSVYMNGETCSSYNGRIAPIILGIDDVKVKDEFKCMIKSTHSSYYFGIYKQLLLNAL